eukprot:COSAG04_NODE_3820_length_2496_cov_1.697121_1_plen_71_part_00
MNIAKLPPPPPSGMQAPARPAAPAPHIGGSATQPHPKPCTETLLAVMGADPSLKSLTAVFAGSKSAAACV